MTSQQVAQGVQLGVPSGHIIVKFFVYTKCGIGFSGNLFSYLVQVNEMACRELHGECKLEFSLKSKKIRDDILLCVPLEAMDLRKVKKKLQMKSQCLGRAKMRQMNSVKVYEWRTNNSDNDEGLQNKNAAKG